MTPSLCRAYTLVTYEERTGEPVFSELEVPVEVMGFFYEGFAREDLLTELPESVIQTWYIGLNNENSIGMIFTSEDDFLLFKLNA